MQKAIDFRVCGQLPLMPAESALSCHNTVKNQHRGFAVLRVHTK